jgi:hypothetical protein
MGLEQQQRNDGEQVKPSFDYALPPPAPPLPPSLPPLPPSLLASKQVKPSFDYAPQPPPSPPSLPPRSPSLPPRSLIAPAPAVTGMWCTARGERPSIQFSLSLSLSLSPPTRCVVYRKGSGVLDKRGQLLFGESKESAK